MVKIVNLSSLKSPIENGLQEGDSKKKFVNWFGFFSSLYIVTMGIYFFGNYNNGVVSFFSAFIIVLSQAFLVFAGVALRHMFVGHLFASIKIDINSIFLCVRNRYDTVFCDGKIFFEGFELSGGDKLNNQHINSCKLFNKMEF